MGAELLQLAGFLSDSCSAGGNILSKVAVSTKLLLVLVLGCASSCGMLNKVGLGEKALDSAEPRPAKGSARTSPSAKESKPPMAAHFSKEGLPLGEGESEL